MGYENLIVTSGDDNLIKYWRLNKLGQMSLARTLSGHNDWVLQTIEINYSETNRMASASRDGTTRVWEISTGSLLKELIVGVEETCLENYSDKRFVVIQWRLFYIWCHIYARLI